MLGQELPLLILLIYIVSFALWAGPRYVTLVKWRRFYPGNKANEHPAQVLRRGFLVWLAGLCWLLLASFNDLLIFRLIPSLLILAMVLGFGLVISAPAGAFLRRRPVRYLMGGSAVWLCVILAWALMNGRGVFDFVGVASFPSLVVIAAIPIMRWARMGDPG